MLSLYCHKNHHTKGKNLCPECQDLENYALNRIRYCPFMKIKTFCSNCRVHCYAPKYREKIRKVMRYSGPRIFFFYHPFMTIHHILSFTNEKRRLKKEAKQKLDPSNRSWFKQTAAGTDLDA